MKRVLLAVGEQNLSGIIRSELSLAADDVFDVLYDEILHRTYIVNLVESIRPDILIIHDSFLPSSYVTAEELDNEIISILKHFNMNEIDVRVVYICQRDENDVFLGRLVSFGVYDIFHQQAFNSKKFVQQLIEPKRFANISKFEPQPLDVGIDKPPAEPQAEPTVAAPEPTKESLGKALKKSAIFDLLKRRDKNELVTTLSDNEPEQSAAPSKTPSQPAIPIAIEPLEDVQSSAVPIKVVPIEESQETTAPTQQPVTQEMPVVAQVTEQPNPSVTAQPLESSVATTIQQIAVEDIHVQQSAADTQPRVEAELTDSPSEQDAVSEAEPTPQETVLVAEETLKVMELPKETTVIDEPNYLLNHAAFSQYAVVFAVRGLTANSGCTSLAIRIAQNLQDMKKKVAVVELNQTLGFDQVHAYSEHSVDVRHDKTEFEYLGMDFYKFDIGFNLSDILKKYDFIVLDMGVLHERHPYMEEFKRAAMSFVCTPPSDWKWYTVDRLQRQDEFALEDYTFVLMGGTGEQATLFKQMYGPHVKCAAIPHSDKLQHGNEQERAAIQSLLNLKSNQSAKTGTSKWKWITGSLVAACVSFFTYLHYFH